jgi:hypothetical protein
MGKYFPRESAVMTQQIHRKQGTVLATLPDQIHKMDWLS